MWWVIKPQGLLVIVFYKWCICPVKFYWFSNRNVSVAQIASRTGQWVRKSIYDPCVQLLQLYQLRQRLRQAESMTEVVLLCEKLQEKDKPHTATALAFETREPGALLHAMCSQSLAVHWDCAHMKMENTSAMSPSLLFPQVPDLLLSPCLGWGSLYVWRDLITQLSSGISQLCQWNLAHPGPFGLWYSPLFHTSGSWTVTGLRIWLCEGTVCVLEWEKDKKAAYSTEQQSCAQSSELREELCTAFLFWPPRSPNDWLCLH